MEEEFQCSQQTELNFEAVFSNCKHSVIEPLPYRYKLSYKMDFTPLYFHSLCIPSVFR